MAHQVIHQARHHPKATMAETVLVAMLMLMFKQPVVVEGRPL